MVSQHLLCLFPVSSDYRTLFPAAFAVAVWPLAAGTRDGFSGMRVYRKRKLLPARMLHTASGWLTARTPVRGPSAPALRPRDLLFRRTFQLLRRTLLAPVAVAVFARKALLLRRRAEDLAPLAVLLDDLVAAGEDLERLVDLLEMVELHRARLVEGFEIGGVDEVSHRNAVDGEVERLDRIRALIRVGELRIRTCGHQVDGWVHQHLYKFVRRRHTDQVIILDRCLDEDLGLGQSIGREIMIREGARLIGVVKEDHRPGAFHEPGGLDELRGRAPHRRHVRIHEYLHGCDQGVEVDAEGSRRLVEARDGGNFSLIECAECRSCGLHVSSLERQLT